MRLFTISAPLVPIGHMIIKQDGEAVFDGPFGAFDTLAEESDGDIEVYMNPDEADEFAP